MNPSPYNRYFNYSAGPSNMPVSVLEQIRDDLLNYKKTGLSVMEMSHRSKPFDGIIEGATARAKQLFNLGPDYSILFLQGGASLQFAMLPMNLVIDQKPVGIFHTSYWTEKAIEELAKGTPHEIIASSAANKHTEIPNVDFSKLSTNYSYLHLCSNNTIEGTQWKNLSEKVQQRPAELPIAVDMSSDIFSRQMDFSAFDIIFAGAQKNLGPSGVCLVAIKTKLADRAPQSLPSILQYKTHIKNDSRYNTPPAFGIYVTDLMMQWVQNEGGLKAIEARNTEKSKIIYDEIDQSNGFYQCPVKKDDRSDMNIVFRIRPGTPDGEGLENKFLDAAKKENLLELKGHRATGGVRASIYNAHPIEGCHKLASIMSDFKKKNS